MTNRILTDFRHLFNTQNFALFHAVIIGLIAHSGRGTVTSISSDANGVRVETVCTRLGIHWYQPAKLTQGLRVAYLRLELMMNLFSASLKEFANSQKITPSFEQDTSLPIDKPA